MIDLATITASISAIAAVSDGIGSTVRTWKEIKGSDADENAQKFKDIATELADHLYDARMTMLDVQEKLLELKNAAISDNTFDEELSKYSVVTTDCGSQILELREDVREGLLFKRACPICAKKERLLLPLQDFSGHSYFCNNCGTQFYNTSLRVIPQISSGVGTSTRRR